MEKSWYPWDDIQIDDNRPPKKRIWKLTGWKIWGNKPLTAEEISTYQKLAYLKDQRFRLNRTVTELQGVLEYPSSKEDLKFLDDFPDFFEKIPDPKLWERYWRDMETKWYSLGHFLRNNSHRLDFKKDDINRFIQQSQTRDGEKMNPQREWLRCATTIYLKKMIAKKITQKQAIKELNKMYKEAYEFYENVQKPLYICKYIQQAINSNPERSGMVWLYNKSGPYTDTLNLLINIRKDREKYVKFAQNNPEVPYGQTTIHLDPEAIEKDIKRFDPPENIEDKDFIFPQVYHGGEKKGTIMEYIH